jgi:hypothetical protein
MWYLEMSEDGDVMEQWNNPIEINKEIVIMNLDCLLDDYEKGNITTKQYLDQVQKLLSQAKEIC